MSRPVDPPPALEGSGEDSIHEGTPTSLEIEGALAREESIVVAGARAGSVVEAWRLALPIIVGMLSTTLMWTVDTILLGRVGKVELAAAGLGGVIIWTSYTFFVGGVQAVNTFVAQGQGARRLRECALFTWHGLYLSLIGAALLGLVLWKFDWILALARPEAGVIEQCLRYSRIRMSGALFVLGMFSISSFFRGIGDVKTPMVITVVANLLNIALDTLLIFGVGPFPRWTTFGAGLATALSNFIGFGLILALYLRPKLSALYRTRAVPRPRWEPMRRLLRVGVPMGLQFFMDMGSFSVFMALMGRLGTDQLAASQIALQILSFSYMPAAGIGRAATTLVGQYLGAARVKLAERAGWMTLKLNVGYAFFIGTLLLVFGRPIVSVFNGDAGVIAAALRILPLLAIFQVFDAMQMAYSGALQGAGDTTFTMAVYAASSWLLFVPLAIVLAYPVGWGMPGGWLGGIVHLAALAFVLTLRFRSGAWKRRTI